MNRARPLFRSSLVQIARFDHPAGRGHRDPDEEVATSHTVSFVTRGAFQLLRGRNCWRLTPGTLLVTQPGFSYRCTHEERVPSDICLSATLAPAFVEEVEAAAERPWGARVPIAPITNRLAYLGRRLEGALERDPSPMAIETLVGELAADLAGGSRPGARLFGGRQRVWRVRNLVVFGHHIIPDGCVAPRLHARRMRSRRSLPSGRSGALGT